MRAAKHSHRQPVCLGRSDSDSSFLEMDDERSRVEQQVEVDWKVGLAPDIKIAA